MQKSIGVEIGRFFVGNARLNEKKTGCCCWKFTPATGFWNSLILQAKQELTCKLRWHPQGTCRKFLRVAYRLHLLTDGRRVHASIIVTWLHSLKQRIMCWVTERILVHRCINWCGCGQWLFRCSVITIPWCGTPSSSCHVATGGICNKEELSTSSKSLLLSNLDWFYDMLQVWTLVDRRAWLPRWQS